VQQQLIVWVITHGALDTFDPTATLGAFIDQEHLMDIVACSTIRGGDQDTCKGSHGHPVAEAIETGAVQFGSALTVITVDVLVGHRPIGVRRDVIAQTTALLCNRLVLLLTSRCNPGVESDFHGAPPDDAMG